MSKFRLAQDFGNRRVLERVGPMVKAQWQLTPETEAKRLNLPAPVKGFMVVDTSFVGIGIGGDVAQELNLEPVGQSNMPGIGGDVSYPTYHAMLLMMLGRVEGQNLAIGGAIEAVAMPKSRSGYDPYGMRPSEGADVRIIGVLGRTFLQFTRFTYDGLNGNWDMEIDVSAMLSFGSKGTVSADGKSMV